MSSTAQMPSTPIVRRLTFRYPDDQDPNWTPDRPEFACAANSVSLMMPAIEPYFVRSIRAEVPHLDAPLAAVADDYLTQESLHHREHVRYNRLLSGRYRGVASIERTIGRTYGWLERSRSAAFNTAFAAASETMAYSAARWAAQRRTELFTGADEVATTLFLWHLAEEVEHKSVAFDVHRARYAGTPGARWRHLAAMVVALALVVAFVVAGTTVMLAGERRLHRPLAWLRLVRWAVGFAFELLTNLVLSLLPDHHPTDLVDPVWYEAWLQEFDPRTGTLPVWSGAPGRG